MSAIHRSNGFSIVEVMVALFILSVGLLGLAALQAQAYRAESESYDRNQALLLLDDIAASIKNNRVAAGCYGFSLAITDPPGTKPAPIGYGESPPGPCSGYGTDTSRTIADRDLADWNSALLGETETLNGNPIGSATEARGCITYSQTTDGTMLLTISVAWRGTGRGFQATNRCGEGDYGSDDTVRRVVSRTIELGTFT